MKVMKNQEICEKSKYLNYHNFEKKIRMIWFFEAKSEEKNLRKKSEKSKNILDRFLSIRKVLSIS